MLIDNIKLLVRAGNGGNGAATFRSDGQTARGGPDGGNGGKGGDIYFQGSHNITDLREFRFKKKIIAENGGNGARQQMNGKKAPDTIILVPWGTRVTNVDTNAVLEIGQSTEPIRIAAGGKGGRGNTTFKSSVNQAPRTRELGFPGQVKNLLLELTLIAEIGLIGLPNAGKSSLLTMLTRATPAIGAYPFTTLEPTIGMLETHPIADIPGLIEGASRGKGLGVRFLKHIEKTKVLLHCMDVTSEHLKEDYETIRKEFEAFDPALLEKPEYIVLNKIDLADTSTIEAAQKLFTSMGKHVYTCSIYQPEQIDALKKIVISLVDSQE
jgi:GTP-binding protein